MWRKEFRGQRGSVTWSLLALAVGSCGSECLWWAVSQLVEDPVCTEGSSKGASVSAGLPAVWEGRGVIPAHLLQREGSQAADSSSRAGSRSPGYRRLRCFSSFLNLGKPPGQKRAVFSSSRPWTRSPCSHESGWGCQNCQCGPQTLCRPGRVSRAWPGRRAFILTLGAQALWTDRELTAIPQQGVSTTATPKPGKWTKAGLDSEAHL